MADDDYIMGELARSDLYPDETQMQPPQNAVGGLTPEDWMMSGQQPPAATYDYVPPQSWLQKAGDLARRDVATYQQGGVPAMMGQLAEDSSGEQDLAGGFGGNIKGVGGKLGAIADLAPHAPPFYSAVEQAVQDAKQNTAPGQQWAGFLRNQPGVKPEEVETLGLGKLFEQPTVSKDAVLGEIAANKVNVGEVVKGAPDPSAAQLEKVAQERYGTSLSDPYLTEGQRMAVRDEAMSQSGAAPTKFSSYTLPGGENYREMLLTLPTEKRVPSPDEIENIAKTRYEGYHMKENDPPWERLAPDVQRLYREDANAKIIAAESPPQFRSSHFDEPNILAHIRTNDRVIDGKKTLFVEEVQSDWHQKGKREGYQQEPDTSGWKATPSSTEPQPQDNRAPGGWWNVYDQSGNRVGTTPRHAATTPDAAIADVAGREKFKGVPDAPFKTSWPDLAMKRVIREAAEKGYDKVAWTPGSVQADRYDLSKQVSKVRYTNNDYLHAFDHNGKEVIAQVGVTPEKLADYLGKDVAQKMLDQTPKDFSRLTYVNRGDLKVEQSEHQYHVTNPDGRGVNIGKGTVGSEGEALDYAERYLNKTADEVNQKRLLAHEHHGPVRELSGLDLKVGGEGMKGFYDEILPATVNKLVKKHGARVEQAQLGGTIPQFSMEGHGPWVVRDQNGTMLRDFNNRELAEAYLKQRQADVVKQTTPIVHSVTITPQLREMALKKGFPLFTAGGLVAGGAMGDLARQDQYD